MYIKTDPSSKRYGSDLNSGYSLDATHWVRDLGQPNLKS